MSWDLNKEIQNIEENATRRKLEVKASTKIYNSLLPLMPEGWELKPSGGNIYITLEEDFKIQVPSLEWFLSALGVINDGLGIEMSIMGQTSGEIPRLYAYNNMPIKLKTGWFRKTKTVFVWVSITLDDILDCTFTTETKEEVVKSTYTKLSGKCLEKIKAFREEALNA